MLFVIIFGSIILLSIGATIACNKLSNLYYAKYEIADGIISKYRWGGELANHEFTPEELDEYDKILKRKNKYLDLYDHLERLSRPFIGIAITFGIVLFIMLLILGFTNLPYEVKISNHKEVLNYEKLIFELENTEVRDEFNIRTKDLIDDVTEWNKDYDTYVYRHNNIWINWFYPSGVIEGVDRINLNDYIF